MNIIFINDSFLLTVKKMVKRMDCKYVNLHLETGF